jgi:hypothetical protein
MKLLQSIFLLIASAMIAALVACSSNSTTTTPPPVVAITATSGTPQSAAVGAAFGAPLVATVTSGGSPASGVTVTFTAPATGASGTFTTSGTATETDTTNASGVATSSVFTANTTAGAYSVTASATGASTPANFSLTNTAGAPATITATAGTPQTATVGTAFATQLSATVVDSDSNPVSNATVTFTAPGSGASGTFADSTNAITTATTNSSGVATAAVFTANSATGTYTVNATVVPVAAAAPFTLTNAVSAVADGSYVFSLSGEDLGSDDVYYVSGVFVVSGGVITGGEQDFVDFNLAVSDLINATGSSITTTVDGNVQITLVVCLGGDCTSNDPNVGASGIETLNGTTVSASRTLITEFDTSATSTGTLDLQNATAAAATPSGSYAFGVAGIDINDNALGVGGVINIDGAGTISGAGSIFDANDGGSGATFQGETFAASSVSAPDIFGRVTFTLNPTDSGDFPQIILAGYIVDATHIRLVETVDDFVGTTGGTALGQTGSFTSIAGKSYVVGLSGFDETGALQATGLFTTNADFSVSGTINYNDLTGTGTQSPSAITGGTYTLDSTGRVTMTGVTDGINTFNLQLYLDGSGHATAATMDADDVISGLGFQQTGGGSFTVGSFSGAYAMAAGGVDINEDGEFSAVGAIGAQQPGGLSTGALLGTNDVDLNWVFNPTAGLNVTGTFTANANGVFTGTMTGLEVTTPTNSDAFSFYLIDTTKLFAIETDPNQLTLGYFELQ